MCSVRRYTHVSCCIFHRLTSKFHCKYRLHLQVHRVVKVQNKLGPKVSMCPSTRNHSLYCFRNLEQKYSSINKYTVPIPHLDRVTFVRDHLTPKASVHGKPEDLTGRGAREIIKPPQTAGGIVAFTPHCSETTSPRSWSEAKELGAVARSRFSRCDGAARSLVIIMPTQQQNQGEDAAVRSAPDRPRRSVVARVLSACVRLWTPNPADDPLCPSSPALDNVDQLPGPSSGPTESSSSPLRRDDKKEDQVTAERLQQEERHILTQPPPTFPALGTGRTSLSREQSVKNSVIRKTSTASEFSCSPTEQGKAAPDQLFSREGSSKVDEELGKAGAGSASETDGSHHKVSSRSKMKAIVVPRPPT